MKSIRTPSPTLSVTTLSFIPATSPMIPAWVSTLSPFFSSESILVMACCSLLFGRKMRNHMMRIMGTKNRRSVVLNMVEVPDLSVAVKII